MKIEGTRLEIQAWFCKKNDMKSDTLITIIKETEKAYYAICGNMFGRMKTMWVPKSVVKEVSIDWQNCYYFRNPDWKSAMQEIRDEASLYI